MKIYVTGAHGLVGSDLVPELVLHGHHPLGLERVDITDRSALLASVAEAHPDWVVHLAAYTDVDGAQSNEDEALRVNESGSAHVAAAAVAAGAKLAVVSTDYVYAGDKPQPYVEDDPVAPISAYGRTKLAGELAARAVSPEALIVRTAWVYGPGGRNFVDTMLRLAPERETLDVVDDQHGSPTYTVDLAAGIRQLVELAAAGVVHVTGSGRTTWYGFAQAIVERAGRDPQMVRPTTSAAFARPAPRPANSVLAGDRYAALTGAPMPSWESGLERYMARREAEVRQ